MLPASSQRLRSAAAFSLMEIMVAVGLIAVIMVALMTMFNQTQKAFRQSITQVDVLEGGSSASDLLQQDMVEMAAARLTNIPNFYAIDASVRGQHRSEGSQGPNERFNIKQTAFFLSRENDDWVATGYYVLPLSDGAGTLYRFREVAVNRDLTNAHARFLNAVLMDERDLRAGLIVTNGARVIDGVVHLQFIPYDRFGSNLVFGSFGYTNVDLPSSFDAELGVLESRSLERYRAVADRNNMFAAESYLSNQLNKVHMFRHRIPVRNAEARGEPVALKP